MSWRGLTARITDVDGAFTGGSSTVNANATTNLGVSQTLAALNIPAGAVVTFGVGPGLSPSGAEAESGVAAPAMTAEAFVSTSGDLGVAVVPEPGAIGLLVVGALGILARHRRR